MAEKIEFYNWDTYTSAESVREYETHKIMATHEDYRGEDIAEMLKFYVDEQTGVMVADVGKYEASLGL